MRYLISLMRLISQPTRDEAPKARLTEEKGEGSEPLPNSWAERMDKFAEPYDLAVIERIEQRSSIEWQDLGSPVREERTECDPR